MAEEILLVLSTFPDLETARRIGATLVEERLAACVNVIPQIESIYRWQGKVEQSAEALGLIKTPKERYQALEDRIKQLHPYELPEIVAVDLATGFSGYLSWATRACDRLGDTGETAPPASGACP